MKRTIYFICLILGIFLTNLWLSRWTLTERFDYRYYRDWFDHSQWSLPVSKRIMSDNELYQLSGAVLIKGGSPFAINPEVPPLAKLFYGASISVFGTPYGASVIMWPVALVLFWLVARQVIVSRQAQAVAVVLLAMSPLFVEQLSRTMLDLPQLLWLFAHLVAFFLSLERWQRQQKTSSHFFMLMSGVALGFFSATKVPAFTPIIMLADAVILWQNRSLLLLLPLVSGLGGGYLTPYAPFLLKEGVISWARGQKWMAGFYLSSSAQKNPFFFIITVVSGWYTGWWDQVWQYVSEWSPLWVMTSASLFFGFKPQAQRAYTPLELRQLHIRLLGIGLLLTNLVLPFWPRYFLLILPLGLLCLVPFVIRIKKVAWLVVAFSLFHWFIYLNPHPRTRLNFVMEHWNAGNYQELYSYLDSDSQQRWSRDTFLATLKAVDYQLKSTSQSAQLAFPAVIPGQSSAVAQLTIRYTTQLGEVVHSSQVPVSREGGRWQLNWDWNYVLPAFEPGSTIEYQDLSFPNTDLRTEDGTLLSKTGDRQFIFLDNYLKEGDVESLYPDLQTLTDQEKPELNNRIFVMSRGMPEIPVGWVKPGYDVSVLSKMATTSGVRIDVVPGRVYNPDLLINQRLPIVLKKEQEFANEVALSGQLILHKPSGESVTLLDKPKKPDQVIRLPQTTVELLGVGLSNSNF